MFAWKIAPALATGNTVVLKPSEFTPLTAIRMCHLAQEAGFPLGVLNVVTGYGNTVGSAISSYMRIHKVAFTGGTLVGRKIMEAAGESNLKNVTLGLGGKSPNIIFNDADLEQAVRWAMLGVLTTNFQDLRIMGYIESGKEGAKIHLGGERHGSEGYFIQPTIFLDINPDMRIMKEEIFGPVSVVIKFSDEEDIVRQPNDTVHGLVAAVFTRDVNRTITTAHKLKAGRVWVNCYGLADPNTPFGGFKQSGIGREMGEYALNNDTEVKSVNVNLGLKM
ncbi:Aldehyde/histidinol dehydrogenase [Pisolithus croceorrhizus]|nr:Aldehyde/histidinol dehydrogenase [Pisolithus croceorrhizus]KAI6122422.1 Aldehyde/histidinol dehydrogenase [Pisolithus croceorrhizus]